MSAANAENKFVMIDEYKSKITDDLIITGTEDKDAFIKNYIQNQELRSTTKLIGTHSDCFHCDEVLATSLLLRTKEFQKSVIVRTRD